MKKVLSLLLATMMIFSTAAIMVSAEEVTEETVAIVTNNIAVSGTEKTTIKMEEYSTFTHTLKDGTVKTAEVPVETGTLPNGTEGVYLRTGYIAPGSLNQKFVLSVEKTGAYNLETIVADAGHLSEPIITVNGVKLITYTETSQEAYFGDSAVYPGRLWQSRMMLQAGETYEMSITLDMSNTNNGALAFAMDDFIFTPLNTAGVATIGENGALLEMENYKNDAILADNPDTEENEGIYMVPANLEKDGTLFTITEKLLNTDVVIAVPVNVEKAGKYDLEMIANYKKDIYMSLVEVYSAERGMILNTTGTYRTEDLSASNENGKPSYFDQYYAAGKFGNTVFLNAGQQNIIVKLKPREYDSRTCAKIDYLKLTPVNETPVALSAKAATRLEYEDYKDAFNATPTVKTLESAPNNLASGGSYLFWDTGARTEDVFGDVLVSVPKSGAYKIEMISTYVGNSAPCLYVDGVKQAVSVSDIFDAKGENGIYSYFGVAHFGARKVTITLFLTEGKHWITSSITRRTVTEGGKTFQDVAGLLDYIEFTPNLAPAFHIAAEGTSTMQFEDYRNYTTLDNKSLIVGAIREKPKGTLLDLAEKPASDGIYLEMAMNVAESGWYDVSAVLSHGSGTWTSVATVYIDGKEIVVNNDTYKRQNLSLDENGNIDFYGANYEMMDFASTVYLTEGEHDLVYYAKKRKNHVAGNAAQEANAAMGITNVCTMADKISVTRLEDTAVVGETSVSVNAYFDSVYKGKVITVLYAGKEMVGVSVNDLNDSKAVTETTYAKTPDTAKVFVWNNVENVTPLTDVKVFNLK